ncbi:MAG: metal-dependent hydrolase [Desulfovibrionaceae bacterium]
MKWVTHQAVAVAAAYTLKMPAEGLAAVWLGSVMPDILDQKIAGLFRNRQKAFNQIHRGATHWFGIWALLLCAAFVLPLPSPLESAVAGLGFGGLAHVALDMCTPSGIPLVPWSRRNKFSLKICKTGSVGEYCFLAVSMALFGCLYPDELRGLWRALEKFLY